MTEPINTYPAMNDKIAEILRMSDDQPDLYAAQYIEELRAEVEWLRDQVLWLTEQNGELARKTRIYLDANRVLYQRVDRLERERNPQTETIRALRIAAESALSYFQAEWAEMDNHPASQYADYVEELARAIGK